MPKPEYYVLDTNTLVSAVLLPGSVPRLAFDRACENGQLLLSPATMRELDRVLRKPKLNKYLLEEERLAFLVGLVHEACLLQPRVTVRDCRDPADNMFLELALAGRARCIVSGDADLLDLSPYRGIRIITSREFIEAFE